MTSKGRIYFISCSNAVSEERRGLIEKTADLVRDIGYEPVFTNCIYGLSRGPLSYAPMERAVELMKCFKDLETAMIFDVSGGDISNGILPYLDYEAIRQSKAVFWGYSDLTAVINAMDKVSAKRSVLYHPLNLVKDPWLSQAFTDLSENGSTELFDINHVFLRGKYMRGRLVGGNIRCLLKLAGTRFWPDMRGRILLLEAFRGAAPQVSAFIAQLSQMGVFDEISGILLGTFSELDRSGQRPFLKELILSMTRNDLPLAETEQIGHGDDAHAALIGGDYVVDNGKAYLET